MPPVLASTAVLEKTSGNLGQAKGIVKLPIGEKSSVGSDLGTVELKLQSTVEIDEDVSDGGGGSGDDIDAWVTGTAVKISF